MTSKKCGEFISFLRKEKNLTQKQLAEKLNVSDKAISRWETGKGYPDVSSLVALSEFFSVSVNELLAGERIEKAALSEVAEKNVIDAIAFIHMGKLIPDSKFPPYVFFKPCNNLCLIH